MKWKAIIRLLGILIAGFSVSFIPSLLVSLWYRDGEAWIFALSAAIALAIGVTAWYPARKTRDELGTREGFIVVTLFWCVLGAIGALPFLIGVHVGFTDAIFEAISGFTTTGATVLTGLDDMPPSVLYHRQQIQWLGGMGVIVLAVAILPVLGVGGMQLYRAETSGISRDDKLTPRVAHTARALWAIYLGLTVLCALGYWLAGMTPFDAVGHAFTTVATGGFSTHDASIAHFDSAAVEIVGIVFMILGGINFAVHFRVVGKLDPRPYLRDPEARTYLVIFITASIVVAASLYLSLESRDAEWSVRHAVFQVASILTSTGFTTTDFSLWPLHVPLVLAILSFTGGCGGSTAGGIKVVRVMLLAKMGARQMLVLRYPNAVATVKLGQRKVPEEIVYSVWGYYVLYILSALVLTIGMMAAGLDLESAFGAITASLNLLGPGLGEVATTFAGVNDTVKWLAVLAMLLGRLEIFTLLILFTFVFWRG